MSRTTDAAHKFWTEDDLTAHYRSLAKEYEQNIELTHPNRVKGECSHICGPCVWPATTVKYREYRGPRVVNL
jgi:hypothetical protein